VQSPWHAIGLNSPEITGLFPTPSTIDESSIQRALEAIAVIKSKIGQDNTYLTPQIVAVKVDEAPQLNKSVGSVTLKDRLR